MTPSYSPRWRRHKPRVIRRRRRWALKCLCASTTGDDRSTLLARLGELGRRAVAGGDRDRAWFEWSTTDADDPYDPAVWRATIPTLDRPAVSQPNLCGYKPKH